MNYEDVREQCKEFLEDFNAISKLYKHDIVEMDEMEDLKGNLFCKMIEYFKYLANK